MYVTNEYTVLEDLNGTEDITLRPAQAFSAFEGKYKVHNFARVISAKGDVIELMPGSTINGIGTVAKPKKARKEK